MRLPSFLRRSREPPPPPNAVDLIDRDGVPAALVGHSHIRCIAEAAQARDLSFRLVDFWHAPQPAHDPAFTAFHPDIARIVATGTVVAAVAGGVHPMLGLVRHPQAFDFAIPERPDLPPADGVERLPHAAVRDAVAANMTDALAMLDLVRRTASGRLFQLCAPPPIEDSDILAPLVLWRMFDATTQEVSPAPLRLKLWHVESALIRDRCARDGIVFVPPPAAALTASGFLRPGLHADAVHANAAYGDLMLAQVAALL